MLYVYIPMPLAAPESFWIYLTVKGLNPGVISKFDDTHTAVQL